MRIVAGLATACLGVLVSSQSVSAQQFGYGGYGPYGYGGSPYGQRHHDYRHSHYHPPMSQPYWSSRPYAPNYGAPVPSYPPMGGFGPGYNPVPQSSVYYSNNYYGQPRDNNHPWHLGHFLLGN